MFILNYVLEKSRQLHSLCLASTATSTRELYRLVWIIWKCLYMMRDEDR